MISTMPFKASQWAFRPWLRPSSNYQTTFRIFTQLIEQSCEEKPHLSMKSAWPNGQSVPHTHKPAHRTTQ